MFRQYGSGDGAFLASKPHNRLFNFAGDNASDYLDYLTEEAIPEGTTRIDWTLDEADRVRRAIRGERLLQRWVGHVSEVGDGWFTADFVTTLGGQDDARATFRTEEMLSESDQEKLGEGALVEWLVYESDAKSTGAWPRPARSQVCRVMPPAVSAEGI